MTRAGRHLLLLFACLIPFCARGQETASYAGSGRPLYFQHFEPHDYRGFPQNWAVTQDRRGVMYVANQDGVLEYDGVSWRLVKQTNNARARSLAVDEAGVVYVGATDDLGYLTSDSNGTRIYSSLLNAVQPRDRAFGIVWGTHAARGGVYFQTTSNVFRWDGERMHEWRSQTGYHTSFSVHGRFFVREKGVGLMVAAGDSLRLVPGGERFRDLRIFVMAPYGDDRILVGTREKGFFLYDGRRFAPFETEAAGYLARHRLYHGYALPGGYFALATLDDGGVVIVDAEGRVAQVLAPSNGLPDGWVNYVFADAQGGLWMALNAKGLVRADVPAVLTRFEGSTGLEGMIHDVRRYDGALYVATSVGLYHMDEGRGSVAGLTGIPTFKKVAGINTANGLLPTSDGLLVAGHEGLDWVREGRAERILQGRFWSLSEGERYVYASSMDGVVLLAFDGTRWHEVRKLLIGTTYSVAEDADGAIWTTSAERRVSRLRLTPSGEVRIDTFRVSGEMAETDFTVWRKGGEVVFFSLKGVFRLVFDPTAPEGASAGQFVRDSSFVLVQTGEERLFALWESGSTVWGVYPDRVESRERQADGSYRMIVPDVLRFPKWSSPSRIYVEESGVVWLGSGTTLYRYDPRLRIEKPYDAQFPVLIRRVTLIETNRMAYDGAEAPPSPELSYRDNAVRFDYAAPSFNDPAATLYQYRLEERDGEWSEWTTETSKQYTNLTEGTYHFRVRARNGQGVLMPEGRFTFRVLPPWYRTWWAYGVYLCVLVALAFFGWRYRVMMLEHRKARLQAEELARERVLNERLQQANVRLQEANDRLTQVDRLKDEFLANTSHELRTPLTAILGFASILREELYDDHLEFIGFIEENGQRLLRTLDALLSLARLRAGTMEAECERIDVGAHVDDVSRSFAVQAARKGLTLDVTVPDPAVHAWLDPRCVEGILHNLLGNAVKFTEEGRIWITVEQQDGRVVVEVGDTGIGIEDHFMPHLFDEFKQESGGLTRSHEGSGLGLAVTYRLVRLMNGEITAQSRKGEGSVFTVSFPVDVPKAAAPSAPAERSHGLPAPIRFVN